jgi:uncharacterized protein
MNRFRLSAPFLCVVLALAGAAAATAQNGLPSPGGLSGFTFTHDFAALLEEADKARLEKLAEALEQKTGAQLAVVTVPSRAPYGSIEEYAEALFNAWGIGKKGEDNGVMLILAVEEREIKIETGYGLEGALPDSVCGRILDRTVIPAFGEGRFSGGLVLGAEAVAAAIAGEKGVDPSALGISEAAAADTREERFRSVSTVVITLFILVFFIILPQVSRRRRGYFNYPGPGRGSGFGGGSFRGGGFGGGRSGGGGASRKF